MKTGQCVPEPLWNPSGPSLLNIGSEESERWTCSDETRKGECGFVFLFKQEVVSLQSKHVSDPILVQVFLDAELERPRPHTGKDCVVDAHGCQRVSTSMWFTRPRPNENLN